MHGYWIFRGVYSCHESVVPSYDNSDSTFNSDGQQSVVLEGSYKRPTFLTSFESPKTDGKWARDMDDHIFSKLLLTEKLGSPMILLHHSILVFEILNSTLE
jgi:hypothetical protein